MNCRRGCVALALLVTSTLPCTAATSTIYKVEIKEKVSEGDLMGAALVYALNEEIRKSAGFSLGSSGPRLVIYLATIDPDVRTAEANLHTVYSVAYVLCTADGQCLFMDHAIGLAGAARINDAARGILARLDELLSAARKILAPHPS